jgi:DNA-binding NtrC family response regulator
LTDSKEIELDARVVVATNRDLKREVTEGRFRQDLYYRVNVLPIRSPALRDRLDDLPLLIDRLTKRFSNDSNPECHLQFDSEALKLLRGHRWPGNIRELENIIERLALTVGRKGVISGSDVRDDLEFNGLAGPMRSHDVVSAGSNELREVITYRRPKCLNGTAVSMGQGEERELAGCRGKRQSGPGRETITNQANDAPYANQAPPKQNKSSIGPHTTVSEFPSQRIAGNSPINEALLRSSNRTSHLVKRLGCQQN